MRCIYDAINANQLVDPKIVELNSNHIKVEIPYEYMGNFTF